MISIGYYENDGKLYVFAVVDGFATRPHLATEGLLQALMDAESVEIAAEKVKAWNCVEEDAVVLAREAKAHLRALAPKCPDLVKIKTPKPEKGNLTLMVASFNDETIAWPRHSILATGKIFENRTELSEFGEFVRVFAKSASDDFEAKVRAGFQPDSLHEPDM